MVHCGGMTQAEASATVDRTVGNGSLHFEHVRRRIAVLGGLGVRELLVPDRVSLLADEAVRVVEAQPPGITLKAWRERSGPLSAGQCVWWGVEVATALAQLHKAGLAHGALTDDAIWVSADGIRITHLVDGPETAEPSDDVAALGSLMISSVAVGERARVAAWTQPMTSDNPQARPTAAMVARALPSCADPIAWAPPQSDAGAGVAREARRGAASAPVELLPEAARWRRWRDWRRRALRFAIPAAVVSGLVGVVALMWLSHGDTDLSAGNMADAASPRAGHGAIAATHARLESIASGSPAALVALTAEGTDARGDAEYVAGLIDDGRFAAEGLTYRIEGAHVVDAPHQSAVAGDIAVVRVTYWMSAYTSVFDGESAAVPEARETAELTMQCDEAGRWLVVSATVVG